MSCSRCEGKGYIVVCIDDMCAGSDECIHGDGEIACRVCNGTGYDPRDDCDDLYDAGFVPTTPAQPRPR